MKQLLVIIFIAAATILFGYAKADEQPTVTETLSNADVTVQIEALQAKFIKNAVEINWHTPAETGNKQFEIQRSANGEAFKTIGIVFTLEDSKASKSYRFKDELKGVTNKKLSYRIKQVDINEQYSFSNIVLPEVTGS
ncbi:MAG: hypothetical protein ACTHLE_10100 [Agriterribacter sp.]